MNAGIVLIVLLLATANGMAEDGPAPIGTITTKISMEGVSATNDANGIQSVGRLCYDGHGWVFFYYRPTNSASASHDASVQHIVFEDAVATKTIVDKYIRWHHQAVKEQPADFTKEIGTVDDGARIFHFIWKNKRYSFLSQDANVMGYGHALLLSDLLTQRQTIVDRYEARLRLAAKEQAAFK